jgi:hypothetical protein
MSDVFDSVDDVMDDAAEEAATDIYGGHDSDYVDYLEQRERDREWEEQQRCYRIQDRARSHLRPSDTRGSGSRVLYTILGVLIVCGALGAVLWSVGNAQKEAVAAQATPPPGVATAATTPVARTEVPSTMASADECERMYRQGTLLKARQKYRFRRLSRARQRARVNRVMRTRKMRRAIAACQSTVPKTLALCIANAGSIASYNACRGR